MFHFPVSGPQFHNPLQQVLNYGKFNSQTDEMKSFLKRSIRKTPSLVFLAVYVYVPFTIPFSMFRSAKIPQNVEVHYWQLHYCVL